MTNRVFVSSDTHFGHTNIIRYCNRPFETVEAMNEDLVRRWNSRVTAGDTVYFLGDFAMGPGVDVKFVVAMLQRLNGNIHMILGNHDQKSKHGPGIARIYGTHWKEIPHVTVSENQLELFKHDGAEFVMCHFPMQDWENKKHGSIHLHGHTHDQYAVVAERARMVGRCVVDSFDIGVDMYGGPVELTGDCRYLNAPQGWD